ncbi:MAG TPA: hypothetical protein VK012_01135 [Gemmatimonadales bacterium]|nr:hypothetical protein [Gemmatimonadales bacterium]
MTRYRTSIRISLVLALALAGCADITDDGDGVIALEVTPPVPPQVEVGDTITLMARALDRLGNPMDVPITWRTADPANVFIEAATGRVTGLTPGTTGRVQATVGTLVSELMGLTVIAGADTIEVPADTLVVAPEAATSPGMAVRVASLVEGTYEGVAGRSVTFEIVDPPFADPATRTVEFTGNAALADTVATGADGFPAAAVTLSRIEGTVAPDTVQVSVRVVRRSGALVPGSGQRVVIAFQ